MIAAAALPSVRVDQARVELVGGTRDGERLVYDRDEADGGPAKALVFDQPPPHRREAYIRRATPSRCAVDGTLSWHYDLDRGEVSA